MTYKELRKQQQARFNKLPMKAAFGDKQFEDMMKSWGLTTSERDRAKVMEICGGAYCLKSDWPLFEDYFNAADRERREFLATEAGLKSALIYEFNDYECGYTMSPEEAVEALCFTMQDTKDESQLIGMVFDAAWREYLDECE